MSKKKILAIILAGAVAIGAFGGVMHLIEKHSEQDVQFGDTGDWGEDGESEPIELFLNDRTYISNDDVDTYLIIGTDAGGEDLGEMYSGELADFLTLLLVDNTTKKFAFIQIDRNSMVDMQVPNEQGEMTGIATQQLCISHWYGKDKDERNANTVAAVETLLGDLEIDNCYTLNMADIGAVNHAIGGVVVDIDTDMTSVDPAFVKGASVLLDDKQAEKFVRTRLGVGDETNKARMARQTQYMQKAYNLVMSQLRENPEYINELYQELQGKIETGESARDFSAMTNQILQYESLGILQFTGQSKVADTQGDGIEHEEFYVDEASIVKTLSKVMDLTEQMADEEDDEEAEDGE